MQSNQVEKACFDGITDLIWLCNLALDYVEDCLGIVPLISSLPSLCPLSLRCCVVRLILRFVGYVRNS